MVHLPQVVKKLHDSYLLTLLIFLHSTCQYLKLYYKFICWFLSVLAY